MAASLKQDYAKILKARADLVMISPDSIETHRKYALTLFREELPYLYVSDSNLDIARRYGLVRKEEHPHGGLYYRSLWILNCDAVITYKSIPWEGNVQVEEYRDYSNSPAANRGSGEPRVACESRRNYTPAEIEETQGTNP